MSNGLLSLVCLLISIGIFGTSRAQNGELNKNIHNTATKFGNHFADLANDRTCFERIDKKYQELESSIVQIDVTQMMENMRSNISTMLSWKKEAVSKIARESERLADEFVYNPDQSDLAYFSVKNFNNEKLFDNRRYSSIPISPHRNFHDSLVNLDNSAVHIPVNVYDQAQDILNDILWSENLTSVFIENYRRDPTLSWQFLGSSKGFTRLYPATNWRSPDESYSHSKSIKPDLYDGRLREWYITAAVSPKDMIILLDVSGSMTGVRKTIALNVVYNILETLTGNDYVLVLKFSNDVKPIHQCLEKPVLATKKNLREIKEHVIEGLKTYEVANFTLALIQAFQILQTTKEERNGAQCNQAIMLITDGAPETYESVFQEYNANASVRLFTYVIGRDVTQIHEVFWIACHNQGYYAQIANRAEVREQVQQYIPVMSRPLVLSDSRIFTWTSVYAHVSENLLTNWVWNERVKSLKTKVFKIKDNQDEAFDNNQEELEVVSTAQQVQSTFSDLSKKWLHGFNLDNEVAKMPSRKRKIKLMVTLATAVFDPRKYTNLTRKILIKNVYIESEPEMVRIANLLGVAGVDVSIDEFKKLASQYHLGVNAYSFLITNNAKILYHPDYRPLFKDWLKPYYSSVDLNEVEMGEKTNEVRQTNADIQQIRSDMVSGKKGSKKVIIKTTLDSMKRPVSRTQHYIYDKIDDSPFSFAIVLPEPYGSFRFRDMLDIEDIGKSESVLPLFEGKTWRVHPDWVYCEMPRNRMPETPEETIVQFFTEDLPKNNYKWKARSSQPQQLEKPLCDRSLLENLIFDARATQALASCGREEGQSKKIIINTFVSTRSGLTRYVNHAGDKDVFSTRNDSHDFQSYGKSIDEVYYRRAVDYYYIDSKAFVYSVPFYEKYAKVKENELMVTASRAIVVESGKLNVPVGVVGVHLNYSHFYDFFFKLAKENNLDCAAGNFDCYVLDNNAFVLISGEKEQPGKFFGDLNHNLLEDMVKTKIYRKIRFFDYQAICIEIKNVSSGSSAFHSILDYFRRMIVLLGSRMVTSYVNLFYNHAWVESSSSSPPEETDTEGMEYDDMYEKRYNKSRPKPCHTEFDLYELNKIAEDKTHQYVHSCSENSNDCQRSYYVHKIRNSNLILLVVSEKLTCSCDVSSVKLEPREIVYNLQQQCDIFRSEEYRKRPESCCNHHHSEEALVKQCGRASNLQVSFLLVLGLLALHCALGARPAF